MKLRLRQIEVFHAVMMTGSVSDAARLLNVSQPAVSRIIAHTEDVLKLKLFHRRKGRLVPTSEGEKLYAPVKEFYHQALRIDEFAEGLASGQAGHLSVCASPSLSFKIIPRAIADLSRRMPMANFELYTKLIVDIPPEVLTRKADVAISIMPIELPNLTCTKLSTGRMICALPAGHSLCDKQEIGLRDLSEYPLVMHRAGVSFGQLIRKAFEQEKLDFMVHTTVLQTESACSLVEAGLGPAIIDEYTAASDYWPNIVFRPLKEEILLTPCVVFSAFDEPSMLAQRFIEVLSKTISSSRKSHDVLVG
jgi:DNA-binding transcriptional LysR family regulator